MSKVRICPPASLTIKKLVSDTKASWLTTGPFVTNVRRQLPVDTSQRWTPPRTHEVATIPDFGEKLTNEPPRDTECELSPHGVLFTGKSLRLCPVETVHIAAVRL